MDRGHPKLVPKVDALNPGLLRLIALTVEGARKHGRFTGVCGGIAGDAQAVPILASPHETEKSYAKKLERVGEV